MLFQSYIKVRLGKLRILILVFLCLGSLALVLPTINNNIDDPNLLAYFDHDESYLMDLVWFYYSGEKRASYQMDVDYGLEMLYLAQAARLVFSKFIDFTPGTFVLIMRWLHLLAWIGALIALWYFIGYHFRSGWQQILAVLLLASRPAFSYCVKNLKPEPLVLLLMIMALHQILKIVQNPTKKSFVLAVLFSCLAFLIKFAGIFLIPAIIAAIYFGQRYQLNLDKNFQPPFSKIKYSWMLEAAVGVCLILLPFLFIICYIRKASGLTFYQEFGLWPGFSRHKISLLAGLAGLAFIAVSIIFFKLEKTRNLAVKKVSARIKEINSYALVTCGLFFGLTLILGFGWIIRPKVFLDTYAFTIFDYTGALAIKTSGLRSILSSYPRLIVNKLAEFDVLILALFAFYLINEWRLRVKVVGKPSLLYYKRLTLIIALLPAFLSIFTMGRFSRHHMLPFFVIASTLSIQGIDILIKAFQAKRTIKVAGIVLCSILLSADLFTNAQAMIKLRLREFNQNKDVVFQLADWWRQNIPRDAKILADHPLFAYVPGEYENVRTLERTERDNLNHWRRLISNFHPQFIYFQLRPQEENPVPVITQILPDRALRLIKTFSSAGRAYQRWPEAEFIIYQILYQENCLRQ